LPVESKRYVFTFLFIYFNPPIREVAISTTERWFASCVVDRPGHLERLKIAVSSANVDVVSCSFVGISAVYRGKRVGPSALPCETPALIMKSSVFVVLHLTAKVLLYRYDSRSL